MSGLWQEHPWLGDLFGNGDVADHMGAASALTQMLAVEAAYARALGAVGCVAPDVAAQTSHAILAFQPDLNALRQSTVADGVVVPGLVRQLTAALPSEFHPALHAGLTSQDVIDTALVLCLRPVLDLYTQRLDQLCEEFDRLRDRFGGHTIVGRTRMQAALEIKVSHRIDGWSLPMAHQRADLHRVADALQVIQFAGPVGDRSSFGEDATKLAQAFAAELALTDPGRGWHTDRRRLVDLAHWMSTTTGALGKFGTDIALMSQQGLDEAALSGGGTSSAMPHKSNPVTAELLTTLARWNDTLLGGMHMSQLHEQERSGSAWMLEWLTLPQMVDATARALDAGIGLCGQISLGPSSNP